MALWISYWLVDNRRVYEMAGEFLGQSTYAFSGEAGMMGIMEESSNIHVSIGDVFSIDDPVQQHYNEGEQPWRVGADNVLGDAHSFWYKLQLWIRSQFERLFEDWTLRPDTIMMGTTDLHKDTNFYAYYDQYPYTISPLSREIISSMQW